MICLRRILPKQRNHRKRLLLLQNRRNQWVAYPFSIRPWCCRVRRNPRSRRKDLSPWPILVICFYYQKPTAHLSWGEGKQGKTPKTDFFFFEPFFFFFFFLWKIKIFFWFVLFSSWQKKKNRGQCAYRWGGGGGGGSSWREAHQTETQSRCWSSLRWWWWSRRSVRWYFFFLFRERGTTRHAHTYIYIYIPVYIIYMYIYIYVYI